VMEVLRQLGAELEADPKFGQSMLEPIDIMGLESFADSAVVIRARIKTLPLKQWEIRREFFRCMKRRFDELGIEIPFPHQTVYFGVDKEGRAPAANLHLDAAAAAAPAQPHSRAPEATGLRVIEAAEPSQTDGKP
jgi:moderate conductance mechanosensitive channel